MKTALFLAFIVVTGGVACAQEAGDVRLMDTDVGRRVLLLDPGLAFGRATLLFPSYSSITAVSRVQPLPFIGIDVSLYTPGGASVFREPIDLISPLRLQQERERKMHPYTMIFGAVGVGAAGYMAYQHVRKYGFLK